MKIRNSNGSQGSVLAVTLVMAAVLGILLASFLMLLGYTNRATMRSQDWNSAIPVAEAGLEDALTHLNVHGATDIACDGWQRISGTTIYWIQRMYGESTYLVTISNYVAGNITNGPVVECRAYLPVGLAQEGHLVRGVRITTHQRNAISRGLVSKGSLQAQSMGVGATIDSYDSSNPLYSTAGKYDPAKAKQNGYMGSNSRVSGDVQVQGTIKVVGTIGTGASGVLNLQSPASAGDLAWVSNPANAGLVQPGHGDNSLNIPFPDVAVPFTGGYFSPGSGSVGGTNYTYLLTGGDYRTGNVLLLNAGTKMLVTGDARLYVTDSMKLDNGQIIIAPNATLSVYVEKAFEAKGNAAINAAGAPSQFFYFGRPQNTSFQVTDNANLVGVFYAPTANAQFQQNTVVSGGATFGSLQLQHSFKFHYDEALSGSSDRLFLVTSWNEMTQQEVERALPVGVDLELPF